MKRVFSAAFALGLGLTAAAGGEMNLPGAHNSDAAPAASPSPAPAASTGKEARVQCRADAKSRGLKEAALKAAVDDCFAKARP